MLLLQPCVVGWVPAAAAAAAAAAAVAAAADTAVDAAAVVVVVVGAQSVLYGEMNLMLLLSRALFVYIQNMRLVEANLVWMEKDGHVESNIVKISKIILVKVPETPWQSWDWRRSLNNILEVIVHHFGSNVCVLFVR